MIVLLICVRIVTFGYQRQTRCVSQNYNSVILIFPILLTQINFHWHDMNSDNLGTKVW